MEALIIEPKIGKISKRKNNSASKYQFYKRIIALRNNSLLYDLF